MRNWRRLTLLWTAGFVLACGDPSGDEGDLSTTGGIDPQPSDGSTAAGEDSSDGGDAADAPSTGEPPDGDPGYPRPDPIDEAGTCPDGFLGPITFDGDGWLCIPPCTGEPATCPQPSTGDAEASCATNPMSSAAPCESSTDCEVAGEMCGNIGGGQRGCLLAPSHCILRCDEGQTCPEGLSCADGPGICQYLP